MTDRVRPARDLGLLDLIDSFKREPIDIKVWRAVRSGRDPILGAPSNSRWCNGDFDVLYTSLEADGACAEIHAFLKAQPVFPSRISWSLYTLHVQAHQILRLADLSTLARCGVQTEGYSGRDYSRTQDVADSAYFLGFDGLIVPSARWSCQNIVLFTDRINPEGIKIIEESSMAINWDEWRKKTRQ